MRKGKLNISSGALLILAVLWFMSDVSSMAALLLAVLAHEGGHWLALRLAGCRVTGIKARASGALMNYSGVPGTLWEIVCAAAGPLAGLLLAFVAAVAGSGGAGSAFLMTTAGISLALSVFNLLPALPLDGGRIVAALCSERTANAISLACAAGLLIAGFLLLCVGLGAGIFVAGVWLMLSQAGL